jgi:hypothetical protein
MRYLRYLALLGIFMLAASYSKAQVSVGIGVGPGYGYVDAAPVCSCGYYNYYPYECAPYGFYGPDYFVGGVFIGVGPWYRGYSGGYGYYGRGRGYPRGYNNDRYDGRHYGYSGRRSDGNDGRSNGYSNHGYSGRGNGYSGHGGGESRSSVGGGYHGGHGTGGPHGNGGSGSRGGGHR